MTPVVHQTLHLGHLLVIITTQYPPDVEVPICHCMPLFDVHQDSQYTKEYIVRQFWQSFVDDKFQMENAIQTKAEFSHAIAVMDKIGGNFKHLDKNESSDMPWAKPLSNSDPLWKP